MRVAPAASWALYVTAVLLWAATSWREPRGSADALAADLTGLSMWGALLIALVRFRSTSSRRFIAPFVALGAVTLFAAVQVILDLAHRP